MAYADEGRCRGVPTAIGKSVISTAEHHVAKVKDIQSPSAMLLNSSSNVHCKIPRRHHPRVHLNLSNA